MRLFGIQIRREPKQGDSFAPPINNDGATLLTTAGYGGSYGTVVDLQGDVRSEAELITRYRQMAEHPEVIAAIDEIVNEAIVVTDEDPTVTINMDELEALPPELRKVLELEFEEVQRLLEFNTNAYEIFRQWYVDGRLYYHVMVDKNRLQDGIQELRFVDPRKIKKVKEVQRRPLPNEPAASVQRITAEYFVFNEAGFDARVQQPSNMATASATLKIAVDSIVHVTSGILDTRGQMVLGHLHQAIRPLNMLRTMEDSAVIYRLVRAPERRVWYIDVGNLPKHKAEQVVYDMMQRQKNKLVYDPANGQIRDQRKHTTMLEDIWLSRREGNKGTQVEVLPGSSNLDQLPEVEYFLKKLYKSLNVPISRLEPEVMYTLGREGQISRDEVKFSKFITRLRFRFSELFLDVLERQLIMKGYVSPEEWDQIRSLIKFDYARDNFFAELKDNEVLLSRMTALELAMPYVGRFLSNSWVRRNILRQNDQEMEEMDVEMIEERENPLYMLPMSFEGDPLEMPPGMAPGPRQKAPPGAAKKNK